ncbi:hypothetical protein DZC30_11075 [Comamonas testosteroni]|uniref:Uncharacterized protein n=1 Tax=Comamonas testosteroni TaxID=285 RepID=A0A373FP93_COMTE|nr:hypothetical protein DZC30_11075 [Comamonas testosteroni]
MIDLTTLRPVLKGEKIPAPVKKSANLPGFAQILGASVSRDIGDAPPKATIAPAKSVQSIAGTIPESTHAQASGGKPIRHAFNTPKQPASALPAASRDNPVTYASLQAAIDAALGKQRDEAKAAAFNAGRSAFARIHKSTAPDAHSGTGNAHALRNFGGRMAAAILGGTARKDEGHSLPHNTGFRAVSGASLKG